jgi:hypothetical protein
MAAGTAAARSAASPAPAPKSRGMDGLGRERDACGRVRGVGVEGLRLGLPLGRMPARLGSAGISPFRLNQDE